MVGSVTKRGVCSALGFGMSKAATSVGYLTAMGSVVHNIGFVTELWFMLASETASIVLACVIVAWAAKAPLSETVPQWPAWVTFAAGFVLSASGVLANAPAAVGAAALGALYGVSSVVLSCTWLEEFARQSLREAPRHMVIGLFIQLVAVTASAVFSQMALVVSALVFLAVSAACFAVVNQEPAADAIGFAQSESRSRVDVRGFLHRFGNPFMCLFVLVGVVGILHTSVLGSASEHIVGDVSMAIPLGVATLITAVFAVVAMRLPDPTAVYKACLPVMLVLLSLLPFVGQLLGPLAGTIMIACNDVCGMLFLFYIVGAAHRHGWRSYVLSGVYLGGSNLFLCIGLAIGLGLGAASADYGVSLLTLLAFAAMYPLGIAFVVLMRRGKRRDGAASGQGLSTEDAQADESFRTHGQVGESASSHGAVLIAQQSNSQAGQTSGQVGESARVPERKSESTQAHERALEGAQTPEQPDWPAILATFSKRYGLTRRESEICSYLVRGRSARHIAEELVISENTVWTHIKNVYAKTATSGKDSLIELFESQAREDARSRSAGLAAHR